MLQNWLTVHFQLKGNCSTSFSRSKWRLTTVIRSFVTSPCVHQKKRAIRQREHSAFVQCLAIALPMTLDWHWWTLSKRYQLAFFYDNLIVEMMQHKALSLLYLLLETTQNRRSCSSQVSSDFSIVTTTARCLGMLVRQWVLAKWQHIQEYPCIVQIIFEHNMIMLSLALISLESFLMFSSAFAE